MIFGSRRPKRRLGERVPDAVDRNAAFDGLVEAVAAALGDDRDAGPVAIGWWSSLHGFAMLRASGTPVEFPSGDAFVQRLLDAYF